LDDPDWTWLLEFGGFSGSPEILFSDGCQEDTGERG
jgi:hypothetical protein